VDPVILTIIYLLACVIATGASEIARPPLPPRMARTACGHSGLS